MTYRLVGDADARPEMLADQLFDGDSHSECQDYRGHPLRFLCTRTFFLIIEDSAASTPPVAASPGRGAPVSGGTGALRRPGGV